MRTTIRPVATVFLATAITTGTSIGCKTNSGDLSGAVSASSASPFPLANPEVTTEAQFAALSRPASGIVQDGRSMKFLVDARTSSPKVWFVNGNFTVAG